MSKKYIAVMIGILFLFLLTGCSKDTIDTYDKVSQTAQISKKVQEAKDTTEDSVVNEKQVSDKVIEQVELPKEKEKPVVQNPPIIKEEKEIKSSVTIAAIGDILIHRPVYQDAKTNNGYDFNKMFELVKPYLESADITIANQETMIGGEEFGLSSYPSFNSPKQVGDALKANGVDIVSLANNHTLDRGEKVVQSSLAHWDSLGIPYTGSYKNKEDSQKIRVIEKNGINIAFLSYTYGTNGIPVPTNKEYLVNLIDKEKIQYDIQEAKKISDAIVVSMHWGAEYQLQPNDYQKDLAKFLTNQKVDVVIGHHPHVLQPYEWVKSDDGSHQSFVVYSLGNFLSGQDKLYRKIGGVMGIEIEKTVKGSESKVLVKNPSFTSTYVHYNNFKDFKIYPLKDVPTNLLSNQPSLYKEMNSHMSQWVSDTVIK